MPIDPSIPLGIRPQQPVALPPVTSPLDRYQKMLTLRHLMTQGQLGTLNLEQTRLENEALREKARQQSALMGLYAGGQEPTESQLFQNVGAGALPIIKARAEAKESKVKLTKAQLDQIEAQIQDTSRRAQRVLSAPPDQQAAAWSEEYNALKAALPEAVAGLPEAFPGVEWMRQKQQQSVGFEQWLKGERERLQSELETSAMILSAVPPDRRDAVMATLPEDHQKRFKGLKTATEFRKAVLPPEKGAQIDQQKSQAASQLRQDWLKISVPFQNSVDSYANIQAVRGSDAPVNDSIIVRQLMKLLEPQSQVLGQEQQDIAMRTGLWDWLSSLSKNVQTGHRLTDDQRSQILKAADDIYGYRHKLYAARGQHYKNIASDQEINPRWVVNEFEEGLIAGPQAKPKPESPVEGVVKRANAPAAAHPGAPPIGHTEYDVNGVPHRYIGGDHRDAKNWLKVHETPK